MNSANNAAKSMTNSQLAHVAKTLADEILQHIANGGSGKVSQAWAGRLEIHQACCTELFSRGLTEGSDMDWWKRSAPVDICHEDGIRSSVTVRVF